MFDAPTVRKVARRLNLTPEVVRAVLLAADEERRQRKAPDLTRENGPALAAYYGLPLETVYKLLER